MTFLYVLGVTEILCSFRLVLEGKTGNKITESSRLEFKEKIFANKFFFTRCKRQHPWAVEEKGYSGFTIVENTISNLPKVLRAKFLVSNRPFSFSSICMFGTFKNPFATTTSLSELCFRFGRFTLLEHTKKWFLWTIAAAQAHENHEDEWDLT